jgi:hypothetical protein
LFDEWDVIQDDCIKMEIVMIYNRSVFDNLVPTKIEETLSKFSKKKSHNLRLIIQYLTLVKKCLRFHDIMIWGCYIFLVGNWFLRVFFVCKTIGVFFLPTELATNDGITDERYIDRQILSVN